MYKKSTSYVIHWTVRGLINYLYIQVIISKDKKYKWTSWVSAGKQEDDLHPFAWNSVKPSNPKKNMLKSRKKHYFFTFVPLKSFLQTLMGEVI